MLRWIEYTTILRFVVLNVWCENPKPKPNPEPYVVFLRCKGVGAPE